MASKKQWPGKKAFYILWNPDSDKPSKVQFPTLERAEQVGKTMADRYGEAFIVMKSVKRIEVPPPTKYKITDYE